jgi:hypothetical protein
MLTISTRRATLPVIPVATTTTAANISWRTSLTTMATTKTTRATAKATAATTETTTRSTTSEAAATTATWCGNSQSGQSENNSRLHNDVVVVDVDVLN